jgi:hypothetical protein
MKIIDFFIHYLRILSGTMHKKSSLQIETLNQLLGPEFFEIFFILFVFIELYFVFKILQYITQKNPKSLAFYSIIHY